MRLGLLETCSAVFADRPHKDIRHPFFICSITFSMTLWLYRRVKVILQFCSSEHTGSPSYNSLIPPPKNNLLRNSTNQASHPPTNLANVFLHGALDQHLHQRPSPTRYLHKSPSRRIRSDLPKTPDQPYAPRTAQAVSLSSSPCNRPNHPAFNSATSPGYTSSSLHPTVPSRSNSVLSTSFPSAPSAPCPLLFVPPSARMVQTR